MCIFRRNRLIKIGDSPDPERFIATLLRIALAGRGRNGGAAPPSAIVSRSESCAFLTAMRGLKSLDG